MSDIEDIFANQLKMCGIGFVREYVIPRAGDSFPPPRKFRYDFFIEPDILIEIQGGIWIKSPDGNDLAHSSGAGITRDCEKSNYANSLRYRLFVFTGTMVRNESALSFLLGYLGY